jgi:hypothetical protein
MAKRSAHILDESISLRYKFAGIYGETGEFAHDNWSDDEVSESEDEGEGDEKVTKTGRKTQKGKENKVSEGRQLRSQTATKRAVTNDQGLLVFPCQS